MNPKHSLILDIKVSQYIAYVKYTALHSPHFRGKNRSPKEKLVGYWK